MLQNPPVRSLIVFWFRTCTGLLALGWCSAWVGRTGSWWSRWSAVGCRGAWLVMSIATVTIVAMLGQLVQVSWAITCHTQITQAFVYFIKPFHSVKVLVDRQALVSPKSVESFSRQKYQKSSAGCLWASHWSWQSHTQLAGQPQQLFFQM